jgi:hypothetical protein
MYGAAGAAGSTTSFEHTLWAEIQLPTYYELLAILELDGAFAYAVGGSAALHST